MMELQITSPFNKLLAIASSVPIDTTGVVHIRGRNDMPTPQQLGIRIIVRDPDGDVIEDYGPDWEYGDTPPYDTHHFKSPSFELYKEGTYMLDVKLLMNRDNPVTVDSYDGALCTVVTEVPPECVIDADCPEGYVCKNGICVPKEKEFPWLPVALIGGGVVLAAATVIPKKPKA